MRNKTMSHDIQTLELTKEQAQTKIDRMKRLERLTKNRDWKVLIDDELFGEYAKQLVLLKSDPALREDADQKDLELEIQMVGRFRLFLQSVFQEGRMAEKSVADADAMLDELRAEGADE